jgi:hypothetical protein
MARARKNLSTRKRFAVLNRDKFTCRYCGRSAPDVELEIDHVLPVCAGGGDELSNLVTSCKSCNRGKATSLVGDHATNSRPVAVADHGAPARMERVTCYYCGQRITQPHLAQLILLRYPSRNGEDHESFVSVHDSCLNAHPDAERNPYWVDLGDLKSIPMLRDWHRHIGEKTWAHKTNWNSWYSHLMASAEAKAKTAQRRQTPRAGVRR